MAPRSILTAENPLLRKKSKKIMHFGNGIHALVQDLFDSLRAVGGLGLAAPQIGALRRIFIVELPAEIDEQGREIAPRKSYVLVNPEIVRMEGEEDLEEGCLSVPGYRGLVKRATSVVLRGQDLRGNPVRYRGDQLLAQAFQHELDHLDGILYLDHLRSPEHLWRIGPEEKD